jgi:hypothetical protein
VTEARYSERSGRRCPGRGHTGRGVPPPRPARIGDKMGDNKGPEKPYKGAP